MSKTKKANVSFNETLALLSIELGHNNANYEIVYKELNGGQSAVITQLIEWATEFEKRHKDRRWDGEWFDAIESFLEEKIGKICGEEYDPRLDGWNGEGEGF